YYISTGSACSQGRHSRPVLDSMGISAQEKEDAVRFSFGHDTTKEAMDDLVNVLKETVGLFG
ncbi:MAG: cysteine desulfurase, partial [Treponema sp.]|nr:cysteine desulfurase [Treponema sp.]